MIRYLAKRLLTLVPVWLGIILVAFLLMHAVPGGPFDTGAIRNQDSTDVLTRYFHLNEPLWRQYVSYVAHIMHGDLGDSMVQRGLSVRSVITSRFPTSASLGLSALLVAIVVGLPAGVIAAWRRDTWFDRLLMVGASLGYAVPNFVLSILFVLVFGVGLGWLPLGGWGSFSELVMPALAMGLPWAGLIARITRATMLEALRQNYIRAATAKGASQFRVLIIHGLRNAMIPLTTVLALLAADLIVGSLVVEQVFGIPGLGHYMVQSILGSDYTMVLGLTTFYATIVFLANLVADISYAWLDPRIRYE